jgi:hypothetical protein
MRLSSNPLVIGLAALGIGIAPAAARTLRIDAATVTTPRVSLSGVHVEADFIDSGGSLRIEAAHLSAPDAAFDGRVEWRCELRRDGDAQVCEGPVRAGDSREATLSARVTRETIAIALRKDDSSASVEIPFGAGVISASARKLPAAWIEPIVSANWRGGDLRNGDIDADASFDAQHRLRLRYDVRVLDLATRDGAFSAAGVDANGTLDFDAGDTSTAIDARIRLARGRLDVGVLRAQLPDEPVEANLRATRGADGVWQVDRFAWRDPAALEFEASGAFDPANVAPLRALSVSDARIVFPLATTRYARGVFAAHGFGNLALDGELRGSVEVDAQGVTRLAMTAEKFDARDPAHDIAVDGLRGGIDWRREGVGDAQPLAWRNARFAGWPVGALHSRWQSRDGALSGSLDAKGYGGTLRGHDVALREPGSKGDWLRGKFLLQGMSYDSADGSLGAANVGAEATVRISGALAAPRVVADATLRGGQYLAGSAYVELPATPIAARLDATFDANRWNIASFEWNDPGVLEVAANGEWQRHRPRSRGCASTCAAPTSRARPRVTREAGSARAAIATFRPTATCAAYSRSRRAMSASFRSRRARFPSSTARGASNCTISTVRSTGARARRVRRPRWAGGASSSTRCRSARRGCTSPAIPIRCGSPSRSRSTCLAASCGWKNSSRSPHRRAGIATKRRSRWSACSCRRCRPRSAGRFSRATSPAVFPRSNSSATASISTAAWICISSTAISASTA